MNRPKIGIVGSRGFIGNQIFGRLREDDVEIIEINREKESSNFIDLENPEQFNYDVLENIDCIIFAAAVASPDYCANNPKKAYQINVIGTKHFINEALKRNCRVVFLSSDSVYGSDSGKAFNEIHDTNPTTTYGKMKKEIEDIFKDNQLFKSVRLSYVISSNDKFMIYVDNCIKSDVQIEIFHPFYRNCVTLGEVMDSIIWLIENWNKHKSSFLNICGPELISRLRIVDEINRFYRKKLQYKVIYPGEEFFNIRPEITEMSSLYLGEIIPEINDSFSIRLKRELTKNNI